MIKVLIPYVSMGGNTKKVADIISQELERDFSVSSLNLEFEEDTIKISDYDIVIFGSYTWGNGKLPKKMREFLKQHIKDGQEKIKKAYVFGTGETQWPFYCRAVDEIKYHLSKVCEIGSDLKIEQSPYVANQKDKCIKFAETIIKENK